MKMQMFIQVNAYYTKYSIHQFSVFSPINTLLFVFSQFCNFLASVLLLFRFTFFSF